MSKRGKYHRYTEEEKKEIRRLFEQESKSTREISRLLGFPLSSVELFAYGKRGLRKGIRYPKQRSLVIMDPMEVVDPMPRKISGEDLKRENRDLREENEYLKDKIAYLEALYEISMQEKAEDTQKKEIPGDPRSDKCQGKEQRKEALRHCTGISEMLLCPQEW